MDCSGVGSDTNGAVALLARELMSKFSFADHREEGPDPFARFKRRQAPSIPVDVYLTRLVNYLHPDPRALLAIVIYRDRLAREWSISLDETSAHRFVLAALVLASKALADVCYTTSYYARVGGVSAQELCVLEVALCELLDWRLYCSHAELAAMHDHFQGEKAIINLQ